MSYFRKALIAVLDKYNPCLWADLHTGQKLLVDLGNTVGRSIRLHGKYGDRIEALLSSLLSPTDIFIDVGANVGYFSIIASKICSNGKVIALEPNFNLCSMIRRSARRNGIDNLTVLPIGAGSQARIDTFQIQSSSGISFVGAGTHVRKGDNVVVVETVVVETLDTIYEYCCDNKFPELVKLDVEGRELEVLQGATKLIAHGSTHFIVEHSASNQERFGIGVKAIAEFMTGFGYTSLGVGANAGIDWSRADVLWSPPDGR